MGSGTDAYILSAGLCENKEESKTTGIVFI